MREWTVGQENPPHIGDTVTVRVGIVFSAAVVGHHEDGSLKIQAGPGPADARWIGNGTSVTVFCPGGEGHE